MKNVLATIAIFLIGWGVKFGWNMIEAESYVEPTAAELAAESAEWAAEDDAWIGESLRDGTAAPAHGWLDADGHGTFEGHPPTMKALIEELHAAGAENVWMVGIEEFRGVQLSDTIAVELPAAGPARDQVFAVQARLYEGEGSADVGQRFLPISFD